MATLTLTSQYGTNPSITKTVSMSDADMVRIITAYTETYFPYGVLDASGNPTVPPTLPSSDQLMAAISAGLLAGMMAFVSNHEKQKAISAISVAPIVLS